MNNVEFGIYLRKMREERKMTVRQLNTYSGVSHSYISQLERGNRGIPSPDILKKLSKPLGIDYEELMIKAGHIEDGENKQKESEVYSLPEEVILNVIKEAEKEYKVSLTDDPLVESAVRDLIHNLAKMKLAAKKND